MLKHLPYDSNSSMFLILLLLISTIFIQPQMACTYASSALVLWFENMIPSLFPLMILSGILIRKNYGKQLAKPLSSTVGKLYRISSNMCISMLIGCLFGFPLGAKTIAEQYKYHMITKNQAQYLLSFCNNIGPIYMLSFFLPLYHLPSVLLLLHMMIPLVYGLTLRYTVYAKMNTDSHLMNVPVMDTFSAIDDSIYSACNSMMKLGGYMIFFLIYNLPCALLFPDSTLSKYLPALFEITSGCKQNPDMPAYIAMLLVTFSGLSCYAQTYTCIKDTDLSFGNYCKHKVLQTAIASIVYFIFFYGVSK